MLYMLILKIATDCNRQMILNSIKIKGGPFWEIGGWFLILAILVSILRSCLGG